MTTVLIADDSPAIRAGLPALLGLSEDLLILGTASDGEQAVAMAARLAPDVVVMDLRMPGVGGLEATRQICLRNPQARVLVLTSFPTHGVASAAAAAGAVATVSKHLEPAVLVERIRAAGAGTGAGEAVGA